MSKRRLLWQLYPSYVVITLLAVVGIGWPAIYWFQQHFCQQALDSLEARADFVCQQLDEGPARPEVDQRPTDDGFAVPPQLASEGARWAAAAGVRISLLGRDGRVLWDSEREVPDSETRAELPEVRRAMSGEVGRTLRREPTSNQMLAVVAKPILRDGTVVAVVRLSRLLSSIEAHVANIAWQVGSIGLAIGLIAAVVAAFVSRQIGQPLESMRRGAERFARGELSYKLPMPDSVELAGLAEAMNEMSAQLHERIGTIVRQNNEQRAVLSSMVEGVLAVDNQQRVISLNKAASSLLGIEPAQAQGRPLQEVVRNADLRRFITKTLNTSEPIDDDVVLHGEHEGVLQARGAALHDATGAAIGAVIVLNDVTDFRRLEHIRRDFVANVSHELKTPITSIKGFVETLLDGALHNPVDAERFLTIVARQADRLNAIIDDLLSLSKVEQGEETGDIELAPGSIGDVIESAFAVCQARAIERNITVRAACDEQIWAKMNSQLLEQAVVNLLDNAIKYSEPGGEVQVLGSCFEGEVTITVSDHGVGIAAKHLSRVFERFYRVDKARSRKLGGTGLGLAIVKHIVQAHHGRVTVKSLLGSGSTFTIHLPLAALPATNTQPQQVGETST
jgi:two-component system phosphate regulon sensor histidine kinase PhoR